MRSISLAMAVLLLAASALTAQEWSTEQQEVLEWLNGIDYLDVYEGMAASSTTFHPEFTAWDYSGAAPLDRDAVVEFVAEFARNHASVDLKTKPLSVQVLGDLAVLHVTYQETATDNSGMTTEYSGRWTITATREDGGWRFLTWTWLTMEPWPFGDVDGAAEEAAVRKADHEMVAAANAHDLEGWLAFVADEAQFLPPGSPPVVGKEALGDLVAEFMAADVMVKHDLEDVVVSKGGDLAYVSYTYEFTITGPEGTPTTKTGKDISIYKKDGDGSWKLAIDIWN